MKLHVLGCGGFVPTRNETSCFLVEHRNQLIMLDAGTGVCNLPKYRDVLERYDTLTILLSHYHLDHLIGLIYLTPFVQDKKLVIYGPGKPAYEQTTEEYLTEFLKPPFFVRTPHQLTRDVEVHDYSAGDFQIGDISIRIFPQKHSHPSFRINIDQKLVYATDTSYREDLIPSSEGAAYLLHECVFLDSCPNKNHTCLRELTEKLRDNPFEKVLLVHQQPVWTEEDYETIRTMIKGTNLEQVEDLRTYEIT